MPLVNILSSNPVPAESRQALMASMSAFTALVLRKSESYVMVTVQESPVMMAGQLGDAVFVDVRSIGGLNAESTSRLTEGICKRIKEHIGTAPKRVYVNFTDVRASLWGWDGHTFG